MIRPDMPKCERCVKDNKPLIAKGPIVAFELESNSMVNVCPTCFFTNLGDYKECHYNLVTQEANMPRVT